MTLLKNSHSSEHYAFYHNHTLLYIKFVSNSGILALKISDSIRICINKITVGNKFRSTVPFRSVPASGPSMV